jgi:transketolase
MRQVAINQIHDLARRDGRVLFIGSDLGAGTLKAMKAEMPDRFFMEGIAEAHIIGMAAGLAMEGFVPYINTIATFLTRRCFEQLAIDICLDNLPVRLIASGGGVVYAPLGPTHIAFEDIAILRSLPNMAIVAASDAEEMARLMAASLDWNGPLYIRLAKGGDPIVSKPDFGFEIGRSILMRPDGGVLLVGTGIATGLALAAADLLGAEGIRARVLHAHTLKPFDAEGLAAASAGTDLIVTVEEHSIVGGLGSIVLEALSDAGILLPTLRIAFPDRFPEGYGSQAHLLEKAGITPAGIAARTRAMLLRTRR